MNMRADTPRPRPVPSLGAAPLLPAAVVPIGEAVCAVVFDTGAPGRPGERPRLTAFLEGAPLARPTISSSLELRNGGRRQVLLVGRGAQALTGRRLSLALGSRVVAGIDPDWLQPPVTDGAALIDGLSDAGRRRLLKLFLTTGAALFGLGEGAAFGAAAGHLLDLMGARTAEFASWCPLGNSGHILSFAVPGAPEDCLVGELIALAPDRINRIAGFRQHIESTKRGARLHLFLPSPFAPGSAMVGLGDAPILFPASGEDLDARPLGPWLERCEEAAGRWVRELIAEFAPRDETVAVVMREIRHGADSAPEVALRHLSATAKGMLLALEITDSHDLLRAVQIERGGAVQTLPLASDGAGHWRPSRLARFVELPRAHWFEDTCRLRLIYRSGRLRTVHEGPLAAFTGALPEGFAATPADAAAIATARLSLDPRTPPRRVETIGAPLAEPRLGLVVAVGDNLDLIRARAAMLFREPGAQAVELVYHVADGPLAAAARQALAESHAVYGLACRLVTLPADTTPTERLLAALSVTRADPVLVLGADVLPAEAGWLAAPRRALGPARDARIVGLTLLGSDGAVLDAGGMLTPETLARRFQGLPAADLPAAASLPTDRVTGECVALTRAAIEMLAAFTGPYPNPDIVLAEAVARLRALGSPVRTQSRNRFVRYRDAFAPDPLGAAVDEQALRLRLDEMAAPAANEVRS